MPTVRFGKYLFLALHLYENGIKKVRAFTISIYVLIKLCYNYKLTNLLRK